jgi:beta-lactamase class A
MEQAIASYPVEGRYAVAVTDLQTGETVSINGDRKQLSGCAMNLFVLLQVAMDMQEGRYSSEAIDVIDGLISATTWSSNAATARDLYAIAGDGDALAGVARVDVLVRERLRLTDTVIDHPPLYAEFSLGRGDDWLTADEANEALAALWRGDLLTPAWRDYLLARLATVKPGLNYLTGILASSGAVVSHKNGFFEYGGGFVDNDLGIVRFTKGGEEIAFAITFLSEGVPTKYADITLGQQLVRLAFAYFSAAYG